MADSRPEPGPFTNTSALRMPRSWATASGSSPSDFPEEHYERDWEGRFQPEHLNEIGRRGLGLTD